MSKGKEQEYTTIKSISSSKDKPIVQSNYLVNFFVEQVKSLTIFVSKTISNIIKLINNYLNKEIANLTLNVIYLQLIIKKII